jgi:hypothetical protein
MRFYLFPPANLIAPKREGQKFAVLHDATPQKNTFFSGSQPLVSKRRGLPHLQAML